MVWDEYDVGGHLNRYDPDHTITVYQTSNVDLVIEGFLKNLREKKNITEQDCDIAHIIKYHVHNNRILLDVTEEYYVSFVGSRFGLYVHCEEKESYEWFLVKVFRTSEPRDDTKVINFRYNEKDEAKKLMLAIGEIYQDQLSQRITDTHTYNKKLLHVIESRNYTCIGATFRHKLKVTNTAGRNDDQFMINVWRG